MELFSIRIQRTFQLVSTLRYGRSWYQNILVLKYINIKALKHQNIGKENYFP